MKKYVWCTDIHLDFLDGPEDVGRVHDEFATPLSQIDSDGVFLTGDISLAEDVVRHLGIIDKIVQRPIYFVLGNHDYYGGSWNGVRQAVRDLCKKSKNLFYLTEEKVVPLTDDTALVGHDGWYDAYCGDVTRSNIVMTDWMKIDDYARSGAISFFGPRAIVPSLGKIVALSRSQAALSAEHVRRHASTAAKKYKTVVILTHVPPWPEAHRHDGKSGDPSAHPWYTSMSMGNAINAVAAENPETRFEVFCGHTHGLFDVQVSDNVYCHVGGAEYGRPRPVGLVQVP